jgi:hypothetical protein
MPPAALLKFLASTTARTKRGFEPRWPFELPDYPITIPSAQHLGSGLKRGAMLDALKLSRVECHPRTPAVPQMFIGRGRRNGEWIGFTDRSHD